MAKYKKGELVCLNAFGAVLLSERNNASVGIIMSEPRTFYFNDGHENVMYWVYDVFMGFELIIDVPQDFMIGIQHYVNEEDNK
jgi:hypothetical protein